MNLFGFLTGASKTADDIFDKDKGLLAKAGGWIGNQQFTEQERAEHDAGMVQAVRDFVAATLSENTDRSRARREIAVFFIKFYALMLFMCGMVFPFDSEWSGVWFNLATSLSVGGLVSAISIFFFGSYVLARHNETKKVG